MLTFQDIKKIVELYHDSKGLVDKIRIIPVLDNPPTLTYIVDIVPEHTDKVAGVHLVQFLKENTPCCTCHDYHYHILEGWCRHSIATAIYMEGQQQVDKE